MNVILFQWGFKILKGKFLQYNAPSIFFQEKIEHFYSDLVVLIVVIKLSDDVMQDNIVMKHKQLSHLICFNLYYPIKNKNTAHLFLNTNKTH